MKNICSLVLPSTSILWVLLCLFISNSINAQPGCDTLGLSVDLGPDLELDFFEQIEIEAMVTAPSYLDIINTSWASNGSNGLYCPLTICTEATYTPVISDTIQLTILFENECTVTDELIINVRKEKPIYIPNGFSPNGDHLNDVFMVFGSEAVLRINSLQIYSRKGHLVFELYDFLPNNPAYGWNGDFEGEKLNSEVYVWKAVVQYINNEVEVLAGDVLLVR